MEALGQLDAEQKQTSDTIMEMFRLAKTLKIRSATKLLQASKGKIPGATGKLAAAALAGVTSRQTMAPGARSTGKSAAQDMGEIYQSDLVDYSSNARSSDGKKSSYLSYKTSSHEKSIQRLLTIKRWRRSTRLLRI